MEPLHFEDHEVVKPRARLSFPQPRGTRENQLENQLETGTSVSWWKMDMLISDWKISWIVIDWKMEYSIIFMFIRCGRSLRIFWESLGGRWTFQTAEVGHSRIFQQGNQTGCCNYGLTMVWYRLNGFYRGDNEILLGYWGLYLSVIEHNYGRSSFLRGRLSISTGPFIYGDITRG